MLSHSLARLLIALSTIVLVTPSPLNNTINSRQDDVWVEYRFFGFVGCSKLEETQIYSAFKEKDTIVGSDSVWNINWNSPAAVDYFGPPSHMTRFRDNVQTNFWYIYNFGSGWWFNRRNTQIFCHDRAIDGDQKEYCSSSPGHIAVVVDYEDGHDALMFCDSWFKLPTLEDAIRTGTTSHEPFDISQYDNRSLYIISAVCQKRDVCPWPPSDGQGTPSPAHRSFDFRGRTGLKYLSTPSAVKYHNKERIAFSVVNTVSNVDGYAWFAMASYVQSAELSGEYPLYPYVPRYIRFDDWVPSMSTSVGTDVDLGSVVAPPPRLKPEGSR